MPCDHGICTANTVAVYFPESTKLIVTAFVVGPNRRQLELGALWGVKQYAKLASSIPAMLRIGTLGAARITPAALIKPARHVEGVDVVAIAARDPARARSFAAKHNIPVVHNTYADLIADPDVDAVYNPLPNSLHYAWTLAALDSGKHVLCEKPIASNAEQASEMAQAADRNGRILMEAFHYRYHPLTQRMLDIVESGVLGTVHHIEVYACTTMRRRKDVRFHYDLAGGALMDLGCYAVHIARTLAGAEPEVQTAKAEMLSPGVDKRMEADLVFPSAGTGHIVCSFFTRTLFRFQAIVHGDRGEMRVTNPMLPHYFHVIELRMKGRRRRWQRVTGHSTYAYQLQAFADAVHSGEPPITDGKDGVANMRVIDDIYRAAGLPLRGQ